jgi:hypothetical protein
MLLASLPACYDMCITAITTNANETGNPIKPEKVVKLITDDYDKRSLRKIGDNKVENLAFTASTQKRNLCDLECYNCKKKGHIKANCGAETRGARDGTRRLSCIYIRVTQTFVHTMAVDARSDNTRLET